MNISVKRSIQIMKLVGNSNEAMSLTEISKDLNIPKTTAYNIINTLVNENILIRDNKAKLYKLGLGIYEIGNLYTNSFDYLETVRESIKLIRDRLSTSSFFCIVDNDELIYIDRVEPDNTLQSSIKLGHRLPMYSTSLGKSILAFYDEKTLNAYLEKIDLKKITKNTIVDREQLRKELKIAKKNGYTISDEENDPGLYCIASPIFDKHGTPIASISASLVKSKINDKIIEEAKDLVLKESKKISRMVGYNN